MQKLMGDEGWGGGACFSLLTPSVCEKFGLGEFIPSPKTVGLDYLVSSN